MAFPPVDFSRYIWRPSPEDPSKYIREAAGGEVIEDVWNRFNHGEQNLFLAADLSVSLPTSAHDFVARARSAWAATRFIIPTIAASTEQDAVGNSLITYRVAKDAADVQAWADKTVRLYEGPTQDLNEVRYEIGQKKVPEPTGEQTFIYVVVRSETSFGLLMHTHHTPFDGAGTKMVLSKYLKTLAEYLEDSTLVAKKKFAWGKEVENLLPVASEVLGPTEDREGERYNTTMAQVMGDLAGSLPRQYGFKVRKIGPGATRRVSHTFSLEQSSKIIQGSRSAGYTVNQIGHAAVCIISANDNPPTESTPADASFVFYGLVDSRARLAPAYSGRDGYPGYCLGMSAIVVPVSVISSVAAEGEKAQLLKTADIVKAEYVKQKAFPSLLAIEAQQVEMMLAGMKSGAPPPPPWMGPWFAGDGIGETYLDPEYTGTGGKPIIKITEFFTSLNKHDPGPFFRVHTWNGKLTLNADHNEYAMPKEDVEAFMKKWVHLMSLLG